MSLDALKQAYKKVQITQKGFLFLKWYHVSYEYYGVAYSVNFLRFKSEEDLYRTIDSKMQSLKAENIERWKKINSKRKTPMQKNYFPLHKAEDYKYHKRKDRVETVEYLWESNVKTIDGRNLRNGKTDHKVTPIGNIEMFTAHKFQKKKKKK